MSNGTITLWVHDIPKNMYVATVKLYFLCVTTVAVVSYKQRSRYHV